MGDVSDSVSRGGDSEDEYDKYYGAKVYLGERMLDNTEFYYARKEKVETQEFARAVLYNLESHGVNREDVLNFYDNLYRRKHSLYSLALGEELDDVEIAANENLRTFLVQRGVYDINAIPGLKKRFSMYLAAKRRKTNHKLQQATLIGIRKEIDKLQSFVTTPIGPQIASIQDDLQKMYQKMRTWYLEEDMDDEIREEDVRDLQSDIERGELKLKIAMRVQTYKHAV